MPRTLMQWTRPTIKVATTQAGLTAGLGIECQITAATVTAVPSTVTVPATGCAPATNAPGSTGWQLDLAWLQDWTAGDEADSLSRFAFLHDTEAVWVEMIPNAADATNSVMTGQFFAVSGGYGGTLGDGSAAATTATWPAVDKPTIGPATVVLAADDEAMADGVTASTNLHRLADDLAALPADAMERIEQAADRIVTAAAPVSSMRGKKRAGLPVRMARNQHVVLSGDVATFRVQGTVPGWLWLNTGTRPHRIPRRHRGNKARLYVRHPGSRGRRAWRRVVTDLNTQVPRIVMTELARVVR